MELKLLSQELKNDLKNRKAMAINALHSKEFHLPEKKEFLMDFDKTLIFSEFIASGISGSHEIFMDLVLSEDLEKNTGKINIKKGLKIKSHRFQINPMKWLYKRFYLKQGFVK